ncbi:MAG: hypothetical protein CUN54_01940 [Phototrophicales bacterium]|nr:MAG: hypothetical protein CUN54_01940 [Phototrophicales bacterium]
MYRSFDDRVLGGVCGGLGALFKINPWWIRSLFVILALLTLGAFAVLYLILWWTTPQPLPGERFRGSPMGLLLTIILAVAIIVAWGGHLQGWFDNSSGRSVFWPGMFLIVSSIFLLRQVRA